MRQRMRRGLSSDTSLTCACEPCEQAAVPAGVVAGGWTGSGTWRMDGSVAMAAAEAAWAQKLAEKKAAAAAAAAATAATDVAVAQTASAGAAEVATTAASTEVIGPPLCIPRAASESETRYISQALLCSLCLQTNSRTPRRRVPRRRVSTRVSADELGHERGHT